jgi:CRP-like cAMP-binding protein
VAVAANRLLLRLPDRDYQRFLAIAEAVSITIKQVICQENSPIEYVYFPLDTVVSYVARMKDGASIGVGWVGPEGMVGLGAFLGAGHSRFSAFPLITGRALRMGVREFRSELKRSAALVDSLQRYTERFLTQLAQGRACNHMHSVQQRCACWLLKVQDGISNNAFDLTQEFLCQMLGVRRASISEVASTLQRTGLIRYSRGKLTILDRNGLRAAACECYDAMEGEYDLDLPGSNTE